MTEIANPLHWRRFLAQLSRGSVFAGEVPPAGIPCLEHCPPAVRVPLRAVLRQAFLAGNRQAPIVDALADVSGWHRTEDMTTCGAERVSIIVPVRGAHDALRLCLECLMEHTPELTDRRAYSFALPSTRDEGPAIDKLLAPYTCRTWQTPRVVDPQPFAVNVNLAAAGSCSEFIVLLNSDAYVGPGWLDRLLAPFENPDVVAVGPMGTHVSGHQATAPLTAQVADIATDSSSIGHVTEGWHGAATRGREPYPARRLVGFCIAVRRWAWDRVGGMDERFANAFCDDDLSLRLSLVGEIVVVPDLLVLHAGQRSFAELPNWIPAYNRTLEENRRRFVEKWAWLFKDWNEWNDARGWR